MASKHLGQDAKCSQAGCINIGSRQSSKKKTSLNAKFDALLNWQYIFCDANCGDVPFDDCSIEYFACKKCAQKNCSQLSDLEFDYLSKS